MQDLAGLLLGSCDPDPLLFIFPKRSFTLCIHPQNSSLKNCIAKKYCEESSTPRNVATAIALNCMLIRSILAFWIRHLAALEDVQKVKMKANQQTHNPTHPIHELYSPNSFYIHLVEIKMLLCLVNDCP
jgi:hypothetical protein